MAGNRVDATAEGDDPVTVGGADESDPGGEAILDTAIWLLADGGLSAFTIDRLASTARVSKTSIYRRWPDKKAVFRAVLSRWGHRAEVVDVGDFATELDQWYADRRDTYNRDGFREVATSLLELSVHDPEIGRAMDADRRSGWTAMRQILHRALDRGEITGVDDVDHLEQFFLGPIYCRAVLEGQELDDATIANFRRLSLAAVGYQKALRA